VYKININPHIAISLVQNTGAETFATAIIYDMIFLRVGRETLCQKKHGIKGYAQIGHTIGKVLRNNKRTVPF
jgi:hypothetical protein